MESELRKILEEVSPKSIERMNRLLSVKDEEIAKLKDEVRLMSAHWKLKTKGLETQVQHPYLSVFTLLCSVFHLQMTISVGETKKNRSRVEEEGGETGVLSARSS